MSPSLSLAREKQQSWIIKTPSIGPSTLQRECITNSPCVPIMFKKKNKKKHNVFLFVSENKMCPKCCLLPVYFGRGCSCAELLASGASKRRTRVEHGAIEITGTRNIVGMSTRYRLVHLSSSAVEKKKKQVSKSVNIVSSFLAFQTKPWSGRSGLTTIYNLHLIYYQKYLTYRICVCHHFLLCLWFFIISNFQYCHQVSYL